MFTQIRFLIGFRFLFSLWTMTAFGVRAQPGAWVPHPMEDLPASMSPPFSAQPRPVVMVGPRNGFASGHLVLRGVEPGQLRMGDLATPAGGRYPGNLIDVQFLVREIPEREWRSGRFEGILPELPRRVSADPVLPVHLSTRIPHNAPPGIYRGFLNAGQVRVPVELRVSEFVIPSPRDWQTWGHLVHIPEAVALMYGDGLWSDEHFQRIVPSLQRLAEVGNNVFHIPVERGTHLGNDHGMLVFREEGGRYVPDFQFVERFLRLIQEHNGPPRVLWLYLYEPRQGPLRQPSQEETRITTISRGGRLGEAVIPGPGMGPADDTWRAVIQGMRQRVQALGWDPEVLMVGAGADGRPDRHMAEFFNSFDPPVRWVVFSHWRGDPRHGDRPVIIDHGLDVGFAEIPDVIDLRQTYDLLGGGWGTDAVVPWISTFRGHAYPDSALVNYRFMPDISVFSRQNLHFSGIGRIGLDGWQVRDPESGERRPTWMRQRNGWFRLVRLTTGELTVPGPDGAAPTLRHAQIREGLQEVEARITLERVLRAGGHARLANEIREFLSDWNQVRYNPQQGFRFPLLEDWAERTETLFALAHRAADALGEAAPVTVAVPPAARRPAPEPVALDPIDPDLTIRTWVSRDGREVEAGFVRYDADGIRLALPGNRQVTVTPETLSDADLAWVREQTGLRMWTPRSGPRVEARLLAFDGRERFILQNRGGQQVTLSIDDVSEDDQAIIRAFEP